MPEIGWSTVLGLGGILAIIGVVIGIYVHIRRSARRAEQAEAKADAYKERASRLESIQELEREINDAGGNWGEFRPTTEKVTGPPKPSDSTQIITKGAGLLLCLCLMGCTRTVYVSNPLPIIQTGPAFPVEHEPNWDAATWERYARTLRSKVEHYNAAAKRINDEARGQ